MGLFGLFNRKKHQKKEPAQETFNPLDMNSVINYAEKEVRKNKPNATDDEVISIIKDALTTKKETLDHLGEDGELPWGWAYHYKDFTEAADKEVKFFYDEYYKHRYGDPRKKYAAIKSLLLYFDDAKKVYAKKGECFLFWFENWWATEDEVKRLTEELKYLEEHMDELEKEYKRQQYINNILIPDIKIKAIQIIKDNPGILQTEVYGHFEAKHKTFVQDALYQLAKEGKITREKQGRTYKLTI